MQNRITHKLFESILGETVELKTGTVGFRAKIESVDLLRQNPGHERESFSVELIADDSDDHGQQIYVLSHPLLGEASLFTVPLGLEKAGMRYQIIFN